MSKEAIEAIESVLKAHEVWEVSTFKAYVPSGEVVVELHDSHEPGELRYFARAYDPSVPEDARGVNSDGHTQGNPDSTIEGAVSNLHHWIFKED